MPYKLPKRVSGGFTLPKKAGGVHRSGTGKPVRFKTAAGAKRAGKYVMAIEHGFKPTKKKRKILKDIY